MSMNTDQSTLIDEESTGCITVSESDMETLNSTIKDLLKLVESQKKEITKTHAALVDKSNDRSDVVNKVLDEVINYNNKPSNNSRDSRDALVAQFEKEMHRQGLNDKLDSLKLKVRNKMKNEVMSEVQSEFKSSFSEIEKKFKKGREDTSERYESELMAGVTGKSALNTSIPINNYVCDELVNSYRDSVQNILLPEMKKQYSAHCNHLAECTRTAVSGCLAQLQQQQSSSSAVNSKIQALTTRLHNLQRNSGPDTATTINTICDRAEQKLKEFKVAVAPAQLSPEQEIEVLISGGHYHQALNKSLCASNLELVIQTCTTIDVDDMFREQPGQPILLSLLSQLQDNLTTDMEVKVAYISESLQSLDEEAEVTRTHGIALLSSLQINIERAMEESPGSRSRLKQLLWSTKTLIRALGSPSRLG